jgi:hypothetical protein
MLRSDEPRLKSVVVELRFSVSGWLGPLHDPQGHRRINWRAARRSRLSLAANFLALPCSTTSILTHLPPLPSPGETISIQEAGQKSSSVSCPKENIALPNPSPLRLQYGGLRQEEER